MNDQPTVQMSDLALGIIDQLQGWSDLAAFSGENLPTAHQIAHMQTRIAALQAINAQQADDFAARLKQIEQGIILRYQNEVAAGLSELANVSVASILWVSIEAQVERALAQIEAITGIPESDTRKRFAELTEHFYGEAIKREAAEDISRTQEEILDREREQKDISTVVNDANRLWKRMEKHYDKAKSMGAQPSVLEELKKLVDRCEEYYDFKRRKYELPVTADDTHDYDAALGNFEYIRSKEGDNAQVYYIGTELDPDSNQTREVKQLMVVGRAIRVCQERRTKHLFTRAQPHIGRVKLLLKHGDPRASDHEWKSIVGVEYLPQESRKEVEELREQISSELAELARFEQAVNEANTLQSPIKAWEQLMRVGANYERFQASSQRWTEIRDRLSERVREAAVNELQAAMLFLASLDQTALQRSLDEIDAHLAVWKDEFAAVLNFVTILRRWSESLAASLARAGQDLEGRQLESAAQTLRGVEDSFKATSQQLPEPLAVQLALPHEYHRLGRILDAYQKADVLHANLRIQVNGTENTAELKQLVDEIQDHFDRVAEQYQSDFHRLAELAEARYNYFVGKGMLRVAGNYEEARKFLVAAARHPDYRSTAMEEIAGIDNDLLPANRRVNEALGKAEGHIQKGEFWEAYRQTATALLEPAEKSLRDQLREKNKRYREQALKETSTLLATALSASYGQPDTLKTHAIRLKELDSDAYVQLEARLQPLIYEMEASTAVEESRWGDAAASYLKAAQEIEQRGGSTDRTRKLRDRADGAAKEELLRFQDLLDASVLAEELKRQVNGIFAQDPDLRAALALALLHTAEAEEESYEETPDELRQRDELGFMAEIRRLLRDAWQESRQANAFAQEWLIGRRRPAYEQARCTLLGRSADEEARHRIQAIKDHAGVVEKARRASGYKLEIISLLSKLSIDSLSARL